MVSLYINNPNFITYFLIEIHEPEADTNSAEEWNAEIKAEPYLKIDEENHHNSQSDIKQPVTTQNENLLETKDFNQVSNEQL